MGFSWDTLPDIHWHCQIAINTGGNEVRRAVVNDLSKDQLRVRVVEPWLRNESFVIDGTIVPSRSVIAEIKIVHTDRAMAEYESEQDNQIAEAKRFEISISTVDPSLLPFDRGRGQDYTHELLFTGRATNAPAPDVALLLRLCQRLPEAARVLGNRRRNRTGLVLNDEYDAQDLLHALVRSVFKYAVVEEPIGIVGGGPSSRADLALEDLGAIVELKYVRGPNDQDKMVKELAEDLLLYTKWAPLRTFIYVVVNARALRDPEALERLGGATAINGKSYSAHVVLA